MAASLSTIQQRFNSFRASVPGISGKGVRYPHELQALVFEAKEGGLTYQQISEASGLSEGGLNKIVTRFRQGAGSDAPRRGPGRPPKQALAPKASHSVIKKVVGGTKAKLAAKAAPAKKKAPGAPAKQLTAGKASHSKLTVVKGDKKKHPAAKKVKTNVKAKASKVVKAAKVTTKPAVKATPKAAAKVAQKPAVKKAVAKAPLKAATTLTSSAPAKKRGRPRKEDGQEYQVSVSNGSKVVTLAVGAKDLLSGVDLMNMVRLLGAR